MGPLARPPVGATVIPHLSRSQVEVCAQIYADESDKGAARELGISVRMVQQHMEDAAKRIRMAYPVDGSDREVIRSWYRICRAEALFSKRAA